MKHLVEARKMDIIKEIDEEFKPYIDEDKRIHSSRYFKTGPGQYGEGDLFIGISVPNQRKVAKKYISLKLEEIQQLLKSPYHEHRLTGLLILVYKYEKEKKRRSEIYEFYVDNIQYVNNWDLVDASCYKIMGHYLFNRDKDVLYDYAVSRNLWLRRISIISTFYFIKQEVFQDTLNISEILLKDDEDLIHKAVGWMLREIGKRSLQTEVDFLNKNYQKMPRTMLRYAIEKLPKDLKSAYLRGEA